MTFIYTLACSVFGVIVAVVVTHDLANALVLGLVFGVLAGAHLGLRGRVKTLQRELERLGREVGAGRAAPPTDAATPASVDAPAMRSGEEPGVPAAVDARSPPPAAREAGDPWLASAAPLPEPRPAIARTAYAPHPPRALVVIEEQFGRLRRFFTTGNVVVKVGMVVLFFGIAFLLRYVAERNVLPIELRLAAVAAGGLGLLVVGWRLRARPAAYGLVLQGGGVGVLYLTVFAAARLYHVLPMGFAFVVLAALVAFSGVLAVLENAAALAAFGAAGGFLAPVLTSTGQGSHVALFSYYALLNAGILGIAWFKAWRALNWLGFVFTFVIGATWGYKYYVPGFFASTEPFLALFFVFYVAIAVLFAHRQPPRLRGLVDGTLVFGVPMAGFALQSGLVRDYEFGHAYSALALGIFYVILARVLWPRRGAGMRLLAEAFLALGVVFGSLAIPFTFDGSWTAAAWSLEAAGVIWVGLRQQRVLPRAFGIVLQIGAAALFAMDVHHTPGELPVANGAFIGGALIGIAGLFTSGQYARHRAALRFWERPVEIAFLIWGIVWWIGTGHEEIARHLLMHWRFAATLAFFGLSAVALGAAGARFAWTRAGQATAALLPALFMMALYQFAEDDRLGPLRDGGGAAWAIAAAGHYAILRWFAGGWARRVTVVWHAATVLLVVFILSWAAAVAVRGIAGLGASWEFVVWAALPMAIMAALLGTGGRLGWPVRDFPASYRGAGLAPLAVLLLAWVWASCGHAGNPAPLPYVPVLNPVDLTALGALLVLVGWWPRSRDAWPTGEVLATGTVAVMAATAFAWLNAAVARGVYHTLEISWHFDSMWHTPALQTSITLAWTVLGCLLMALAAARLRIRGVWIAGATLLGVVVAKLFLVDLADIGTVARIVSFIGVGVLLLVIGHVAPIPPRAAPGGAQ